MRYAFVESNIIDLRGEPSHQSERLSQMFFADTVEILEEQAGFARVRQFDGYSGWVDRRFLKETSVQQATAFRKKLNAVVIAPTTKLMDLKTKQTIPPHFLYYGTPVYVSSHRARLAVLSSPDLGLFMVKGTDIRPIGSVRVKQPAGAALVREAKRFLGVPYLWGGTTPAGFDCSGLIRTICGRFGIYLPRDTKDQINSGRHIERSDVKTGDLLFFKQHVGFAIGKDQLIHASRGGGGVRINSLVAGQKDYREDLDRDFQEARRILT